jgi:hypothetical protein
MGRAKGRPHDLRGYDEINVILSFSMNHLVAHLAHVCASRYGGRPLERTVIR